MDLLGYIYDLQKIKPKLKELTSEQENVLLEFTGKPRSTYDIYSKQMERPTSIRYKNVRKKVIVLRDIGYIELTKLKNSSKPLHKAKYYGLSHLGLFYLLTRRRFRNFSPLLENYESHQIFQIFLSPFFKPETILLSSDSGFHWELSNYLSDCLMMTYQYSDSFRIGKRNDRFYLESGYDEDFESLSNGLQNKIDLLGIQILSSIIMNSSPLDKLHYKRLKHDEKFSKLIETTELKLIHKFKQFRELTV